MKAFDGLMFWIGLLVQLNKYSNVVCADKKYRSRLPVPFGLYAAVSWPALPSSLCGRSPARIPVRGVLSTPVLSTTANILASCYGEIDRHNDFF